MPRRTDPRKSHGTHLNLRWSDVIKALWKARLLIFIIAMLALIVVGTMVTAS